MPASHDPVPAEKLDADDDASQAARLRQLRRAGSFATTRWSLVRAAGHADGSAVREALAALCDAYWYPLYAYVRRRGHQPAEAQDLTQGFFTYLLEGNILAVADRQRGRFRSFLLQSLKNFLSTQRRRQSARKRAHDQRLLSLDFDSGETRYRLEPADTVTPERLFERRWALTLLEAALAQLRAEYETTGRANLFTTLEAHLLGNPDALPYAALGERLGMSEGAVKVAAHRLRRRYREILRGQIAETVGTPEEVDDELRDLLNALAS